MAGEEIVASEVDKVRSFLICGPEVLILFNDLKNGGGDNLSESQTLQRSITFTITGPLLI